MSSTRKVLPVEANAKPYPAATVISRPTFLDDKHQDADNHPLHCSICCDISFDPVITPCQHVFCRNCIISAIRSNPSCPNDRCALNANSLKNITGLHEYIYDHTRVKCPHCYKWSGQMQQYKRHVATCTSSSYVQTLEQKVQDLKTQLITSSASIQRFEATLVIERHNVSMHTEAYKQSHLAVTARLQNKIDTLENDVSALKSRISSMGPAFDPNYRNDKNNAMDLSRISVGTYSRNQTISIRIGSSTV